MAYAGGRCGVDEKAAAMAVHCLDHIFAATAD
jgi:hypothetical protein